jgi:hypothetical protein
MCDFSLHAVRSRPAKVGDKLTTRLFNSGTRGFCASEDEGMAVCLLPGTELSFAEAVRRSPRWPWNTNVINYKTAIFRQINKEVQHTHHDALEFPTGQIVLLTLLEEGQQATVLQLPTTAGVKVPREEEAGVFGTSVGQPPIDLSMARRALVLYAQECAPRGAASDEA